MQHDHLARPANEREPIPLMPAELGGFRTHQTDALTDDVIEAPLTVRPTLRASSAVAMMRDAATSAALVTHTLIDGRYDRVVGLVTTQKLQQELLGRWEPELVVGDEMVPWEEVSIVNAASVRSLTTEQMHEMFRGTGLGHVVVVDNADDSYTYVVGLLSRATLARRLDHLAQFPRRRPEVALPDFWEIASYAKH